MGNTSMGQLLKSLKSFTTNPLGPVQSAPRASAGMLSAESFPVYGTAFVSSALATDANAKNKDKAVNCVRLCFIAGLTGLR
jgi:hypothetical protein